VEASVNGIALLVSIISLTMSIYVYVTTKAAAQQAEKNAQIAEEAANRAEAHLRQRQSGSSG
jgi:hypothetical protein